ncbi:MAG: hypothetical protein ACOX4L_05420 [Bacillota bacterium]|jgi:hypothetical protein
MSKAALLQIYIKQGQEYKKMLKKVNTNGCHSAKIKKIDQQIKRAEKALKSR